MRGVYPLLYGRRGRAIVALLGALGAAPPAAADSAGGGGGGGGGSLDPAALEAAVARAEAGVEGKVAKARELMGGYLPEAATQAILFAPIRNNVLDALGQLETLLNALDAPSRAGFAARLAKLAASVDM